jgi:RNA polymerase sigma-70 factor (sigma-E family)
VDEPDGFEEFVACNSRALLRTAWLLTGDWALAEDLVQSTLLKVVGRWSRIVESGRPDGYVRRVMLTTYLAWRGRRWNSEHPYAEVPDHAVVGDAFADAEERIALLDALRALPARQRAVIALRYLEDLSELDTAAALGCSVGTVKSQSARALRALETRLGRSADPTREVSR